MLLINITICCVVTPWELAAYEEVGDRKPHYTYKGD